MADHLPQLELGNQLCFALYRASRAAVRAYGPVLGELGITYPQYLVLLVLWEADEPMSVGAIGEAREMDEQAIKLKQEYDGKLEGVRKEAAVDRERIRSKVKRMEGELMTDARSAMQERLDTGMAKLDGEITAIRSDLESQRVSLAADIASKVLGRPVQSEEARS